VEAGVRYVSDPLIVQTANPLVVKLEDLDGLISALEAEGLDARRAYVEQRGYGVTWWEVVLIWVSARSAEAVIDRVVGGAVEWMRERFRREPEGRQPRPKVALIVYYEGEEGHVAEKVEMRTAGDEPIRKPTDESERYTRKKPPRRTLWWPRAPRRGTQPLDGLLRPTVEVERLGRGQQQAPITQQISSASSGVGQVPNSVASQHSKQLVRDG